MTNAIQKGVCLHYEAIHLRIQDSKSEIMFDEDVTCYISKNKDEITVVIDSTDTLPCLYEQAVSELHYKSDFERVRFVTTNHEYVIICNVKTNKPADYILIFTNKKEKADSLERR